MQQHDTSKEKNLRSFNVKFNVLHFIFIGFMSIKVESWCRGEWHRGVVIITTAQLHSTKSKLRFYAGSNPVRSVSEIRDGEDL